MAVCGASPGWGKILFMIDAPVHDGLRTARMLTVLAIAVLFVGLAAWPAAAQTSHLGDRPTTVTTAALVEGTCAAVPRVSDSRAAHAWTQVCGSRLGALPRATGLVPTTVCPCSRPPRAVLALHHVLLI